MMAISYGHNLLNWATSQSGVIPYNPKRILLLTSVKDITELFNSQLEAKQISLITLVDEEVEAYADFNAVMLVMRNLLSNALKFTNPGGKITIECTTDDERVEVRITDNGVGIAPNRLIELLKYTSSTTTEGTAKEKGTGLGLILCKEYAILNRGELKVESEVGVGTTFTFDLPKFRAT
jgi:two-component system sensor histidine kinase/response regulator